MRASVLIFYCVSRVNLLGSLSPVTTLKSMRITKVVFRAMVRCVPVDICCFSTPMFNNVLDAEMVGTRH
jgi:hypothetical protein